MIEEIYIMLFSGKGADIDTCRSFFVIAIFKNYLEIVRDAQDWEN